MSPASANCLLGLACLVVGSMLSMSARSSLVASLLRGFPRSRVAGLTLFAAATFSFLYVLWNTVEAENMGFKTPLIIATVVLAVATPYCIPDFLSVRGLSIIILVTAKPLLDSSFMMYSPELYPLKLVVYFLIILAMFLAVQPWRVRDFINWVLAKRARSLLFGWAALSVGMLLVGIACYLMTVTAA